MIEAYAQQQLLARQVGLVGYEGGRHDPLAGFARSGGRDGGADTLGSLE